MIVWIFGEMERIEQDRDEETNEGIPRIVIDRHKKVKVNMFEINEMGISLKVLKKLKQVN